MPVRLILFIIIVVLTGTAGDLALSYGMKQVGEAHPLTPANIVRVLVRAFRTVWLWVGFALMVSSFLSLLTVLSWADVSVVVPATALSYVAGALGAKFLLRETVAPVRWAGVVLVCLGVALLSLS